MALSLEEVNAFTHQEIVPRTTDVIFKQSPLLTRILSKKRAFPGGLYIQRPIIYNRLNGGAFGKDDTFNTAYVKTDTAFTAYLKNYYVNVTLYGLDDVLNRGRNAAFSQVETKMAAASMSMAEMIAKAMYRDGQTSNGTGVLSGTKELDGLLAWIDDGNSYSTYSSSSNQDKSFATIGGITRTDLFPAGLPTAFASAKTPIGNVQGANSFVNRAWTTYALLDLQEAFGAAWYGNEYPDIIVGTQTLWNKVWNSLQSTQRYYAPKEVDVAAVGFRAFTWNGLAEVVVDKYMPSDGTNGMALGLNTNYLELHVSDNKKFQFGFTGFKDAQGTIDLCGQFLVSLALMYPSPRTAFKMVGTGIV